MAEFSLPSNSVVQKGTYHYAKNSQRQHIRVLQVYRWQAESAKNPQLERYEIDLDNCGPMLLDALFYIKNYIDSSFSFRRSCREGVCGSCAMQVNGQNSLACTESLSQLSDPISVYPLPHMAVMKDLIVDMRHFYAQYSSIKPWLQTDVPAHHDKERLQSKTERNQLDGLYECILCACCSTSCPSYWWNSEQFLGPAILLQLQRWLTDSRDDHTGDRLDAIEDSQRLYRCHTILNCSNTCPKGLNPGQAIASIKRQIALRK